MLKVTFPSNELYDEKNEKFINTEETSVLLEHSLVSISKWESKWKKAFLGKGDKTEEESRDYIRCMIVTQKVDPNIMFALNKELIDQIEAYISDEMTATTINNMNKKSSNREIITSELIYYWMVTLNIPFECQKWHLNRLLTLISVCNIKNSPPTKMNKKEMASRNKQLNAARRRKFNHKG